MKFLEYFGNKKDLNIFLLKENLIQINAAAAAAKSQSRTQLKQEQQQQMVLNTMNIDKIMEM